MKAMTPQTPRLVHRFRSKENPSKRPDPSISIAVAGRKLLQKNVTKCLDTDFALTLTDQIAADIVDPIPVGSLHEEASVGDAATGDFSEISTVSSISTISTPLDGAIPPLFSPPSESSFPKPEPLGIATESMERSRLIASMPEAQIASDLLSSVLKETNKSMDLDAVSKKVLDALIEAVARNMDIAQEATGGVGFRRLVFHRKVGIGINCFLLLIGIVMFVLAVLSRLEERPPFPDFTPT